MLRVITVIAIAGILQACAGAVVVGAGVAAGAATDRRSIGTQFDDQTIELQVLNALGKDEQLWRNSKLSVVALNGRVLVVGQSPDESSVNKITQIVREQEGVTQVLNEVRAKPPVSLGVRSNDSWITTKIKFKIYEDSSLPPGKIKVITEDSEVFLIGLVTAEEQKRAIDIARHETGVSKVIKVFEVIENS
ncbi:divisome-associated lipoprotein YraP [Agarivorans sp. TSD2052]|uniref:division/outer membrane stress-associated lipid-binding lipoprotein n=1 Tax=Agarivorans sp. TSD2052 TaxID=2937286 RepID=UPI00200E4EE9|nr:division/outer membrane stress-associated lipid-binding lipoprotein [Agarivorans sp. TSD2052]UPW17954.1 divisome-associated lipoprotein YraP [Agarivorans sp. TSD2052]